MPSSLRDAYDQSINGALTRAGLKRPQDDFTHQGGKAGTHHTEHLGHLLAQMQWLQRAYPGASW